MEESLPAAVHYGTRVKEIVCSVLSRPLPAMPRVFMGSRLRCAGVVVARTAGAVAAARQRRLCLRPLPHGHGALRETAPMM